MSESNISALLAEIQSLRQDLAALSARVLALETREGGRRSEPTTPYGAPVSVSSPVTVNYTPGGGPLPAGQWAPCQVILVAVVLPPLDFCIRLHGRRAH